MTVLFFLCTLLGILARQAHAKAVFAHFMVGNANNYTVADWQTEISLAQAAHIDAFALNIAQGDKTIAPSLELAFQAAGGAGFQLFFSFDYAGGDRAWSKQEVIDLCSQYCANGAYYHYNGKPFISTFEGPANAEDWHDIKSATSCFFMPDWSSSGAKPALLLADGVVDGLFNWAAWPWGNQDMDTYIDASYIKYLDEAGGKPYMMPASPWFYTNLPGYNKNWMWRGDDLWYDRWVEIIYNQPEFVEIISWNDFGESHYIGPLVDKAMEAFHIGKAPYNYATDMPHDGWRAFLPFLIDTYKSGRATITQEGLVAWYRLSPAAACKDGGTVGNTASQLQLEFPPAQVMQDKVFFSALLTSTATVTVTVGPVTKTPNWSFTPDGGVGVYHGSVSFEAVGEVTITLSRGSQQLAQIKGPKIELFCPSGITNWNAWVGSQMASGGVSATPTLKTSEQKCIEGTGAKNFAGLCKNACKYGYCPVSACVCKAMGKPVPTPTTSGAMGYPLPGEDASYSGMCEYNCLLGYCPSDACGYDEVPLAIATVSAFLPPACTGGKARDSSLLDDLCSWTCKYGFCPIRVCTCTQQGALKEPPAQIDGHHGGPVSGLKDEGLCEFACSRGDICPAEVCVDRSPGAITSKGVVPKSSTGDAATWASDNGQECVMTDCLDDKQVNVWDKRFGIAPNGGPFKDNCGSGKNKYILCPIDAMPSTCQWRGGETGCSCHGQCHATEVTLFHSSHGSKNCCKPGQQAFCCVSDTWSNVVDSCSFSESDECPSDKKRNGYRNVYKCEYGLSEAYCGFEKQALCCAAEFDKCHWIGKGTCDDNECASYEVELALDKYGDTKSQCAAGFNGRKKVLCCTPPHKLNPFIGVSLDKLFPTLPPPTDVPDYDLEHIRFDGDSPEAFGFVVIDGPPDVVTSLTKRDGSHIEFLDCEPSKKHNLTTHTVRYICLDASDSSNCDDIHIGGAPGTIVKLPEGCGFATYGVVSEVRESNNPFVPAKFHGQAHDSTVVYEMDFTYDFSLTKRTSEPVYVRIDYSHIHDYWTQVVAGDSIMKRNEPGGLLKRFWSTKSEIWGQKLKTIRAEKLPGSYQVSLGKKDFSQLLYQEDNSGQCGGNGFLSVNLKGSVTSALRWGFTMVGTISPSLKFEEAYGFFDVDMSLAGTLSFDGRGELGILGRLGSQQLFDEHISDFGWTHPGIVEFRPNMNVDMSLRGASNIDGKFDLQLRAGSSGVVRTHSPPSIDTFTGDVVNASPNGAFSGAVRGQKTDKTDSSGTLFGVSMFLRTWMEVSVFGLGTSSKVGNAEFSVAIPHDIDIKRDTSGGIEVVDADQQVMSEAYSSGISSTWEADNSAHVVGVHGTPHIVYSGAGGDPPDRGPPKLPGDALFNANYISCAKATVITCLNSTSLLGFFPSDYLVDFDNGERIEGRGLLGERTENSRPYNVRTPSGQPFVIHSPPYPNGGNGAGLLAVNPNAGRYNLEDPEDCENTAFTDNGDPAATYVPEHIIELGWMPELLEYFMTGVGRAHDGRTIRSAQPIIPESIINGGVFTMPWGQWDAGGRHPNMAISPLDELWDAMGSVNNPAPLVNAEALFNQFKQRLWRGQNPMADTTWRSNDLDNTTPLVGINRAQESLSIIRMGISVFSYVNSDHINSNMAGVILRFQNILRRLDLGLATNGFAITRSENMMLESFHYILMPRIEAGENWVIDRIQEMREDWQAVLTSLGPVPTNGVDPNASYRVEIESLLSALDGLERGADGRMFFDNSLFPAPPL